MANGVHGLIRLSVASHAAEVTKKAIATVLVPHRTLTDNIAKALQSIAHRAILRNA